VPKQKKIEKQKRTTEHHNITKQALAPVSPAVGAVQSLLLFLRRMVELQQVEDS